MLSLQLAPSVGTLDPKTAKVAPQIAEIVDRIFRPRPIGNEMVALDPSEIYSELIALMKTHGGAPLPERPHLENVSDESLDRIAIIERPVTRRALIEFQDWAREHWLWSGKDFAQALAISRGQLFRNRSGSRRISEKTESNFHYWLRVRAAWQRENRKTPFLKIQFAHGHAAQMKRIKVFNKPRRCRVCHNWYEPHQSRQVRCSGCVAESKKHKKILNARS